MGAHTIGDNFQVHVTAETEVQFNLAMQLAFNDRKAEYFAVSPHFGLIFLWYAEDAYVLGRTEFTHHLPTVYETDLSSSPFKYIAIHPQITESYQIQKLPFKMTAGQAADFAWAWLQEQDPRDPPPDHDGHNEKGYEVSTGDMWNHVGCHRGAICAVRREWIWIGK